MGAGRPIVPSRGLQTREGKLRGVVRAWRGDAQDEDGREDKDEDVRMRALGGEMLWRAPRKMI